MGNIDLTFFCQQATHAVAARSEGPPLPALRQKLAGRSGQTGTSHLDTHWSETFQVCPLQLLDREAWQRVYPLPESPSQEHRFSERHRHRRKAEERNGPNLQD